MDRNTTMRSTNASRTTVPITQGSRPDRYAEVSAPAAVSPPTKAVTPLPAVRRGITWSRSWWTSDAVWADCGAVVG